MARLGATTLGTVPSAEGRVSPISSYAEEWAHAVAAVREVALYAGEYDVRLAIEPLNRYEAFLVNRVEQACAFASEVGVDGVGVIVDLFHMNIEEADSAAAIDLAGDRLLELHLADSNREGLGSGHAPARELLERTRACGFGAGGDARRRVLRSTSGIERLGGDGPDGRVPCAERAGRE